MHESQTDIKISGSKMSGVGVSAWCEEVCEFGGPLSREGAAPSPQPSPLKGEGASDSSEIRQCRSLVFI